MNRSAVNFIRNLRMHHSSFKKRSVINYGDRYNVIRQHEPNKSTSTFFGGVRSFASAPSYYDTDDATDSSSATAPFSLDKLYNPTEEHSQIRSLIRTFTADQVEPQANHYNKHELLNIGLFSQIQELGLDTLTLPEPYGAGMDATAVAIVHEELSYSDPAFCLAYLAHSILFINNLGLNGNKAQKDAWLLGADSSNGSEDNTRRIVGGMCMSEPGAGTDVLGMTTKATPSDDGKGWVLNGQKMWITNGTLDGKTTADVYLVYAKTGQERMDISQFIVSRGMDGFKLGQQIKDKLGMRASPTAELVFDNVFVPNENLVGKINGGALCMMRNLEIERVALAAMAIGIARRCVDEMVHYSKERKAFGKNIYKFGQIQKAIAESYAEYMAGKSYVYSVANGLDLQTQGNSLDTDGIKLYSASMAKNVADRAIQVMGGYGYVGEYNVERLWRDAKLLEIGGGTNESHHKNMMRDLARMNSLLA